MTNASNQDSTERFRAIMDGDKDEDEEPKPQTTRPPDPPRNLLDLLPRAPNDASPAPGPRAASPPEAKTRQKARARLKVNKERLVPAFWTVSSVMSLAVDVVLIAVIIILLLYVRRLNIRMNELLSLSSMPLETVSGLYANFEDMSAAHIVTTIPFTTEILVQFDLQINQQSEVVLSQDTLITGARVTLTTGGLEISNAPANIVLPAGTPLPITLSLLVPVSQRVPVTLQVPVDIALAQTDLGPPFLGLMDVLEPLYCLLDKNAVDSQGVSICEKAKTP